MLDYLKPRVILGESKLYSDEMIMQLVTHFYFFVSAPAAHLEGGLLLCSPDPASH